MNASADPAAHLSRSLADTDPSVREALDDEGRRQLTQIELIASENVMRRAVREALGHEIGNKTLEGYPGNRFHGGGEYVDVVERLAIERASDAEARHSGFTGGVSIRRETHCGVGDSNHNAECRHRMDRRQR